ncbi:MAG TPA: hypothetical protein VGR88_04980, partial [Ktedonobacterales bacterium]|nr:hypothetical protein [Ktedonobacterales bacterium]
MPEVETIRDEPDKAQGSRRKQSLHKGWPTQHAEQEASIRYAEQEILKWRTLSHRRKRETYPDEYTERERDHAGATGHPASGRYLREVDVCDAHCHPAREYIQPERQTTI